jgi:hypothetical protein
LPLNFRDRVLIARRPRAPGPPLTGTAVGRYLSPTREMLYTIVSDAPTAEGRAMLDCFEYQLLVLPGLGRVSPDEVRVSQ